MTHVKAAVGHMIPDKILVMVLVPSGNCTCAQERWVLTVNKKIKIIQNSSHHNRDFHTFQIIIYLPDQCTD